MQKKERMNRRHQIEQLPDSLLSFFSILLFQDDGYDETLIPVDFKTVGQIIDDDILKILVKPMKAGVHVTVLMDCCHS
jgi:hypothetical protein